MEDRLYKFARLVEVHSFTKAAAQLHISQPALTTAIKKLERELHTELLVRGGHTFVLTGAGQIAYEAAKELSARTHNLKLRLQEAASEKITLNLGMIDSIANLLFVHGKHLRELEQGTRLSLTINNSAQLIRLVTEDELDVALVAEPAHLPGSLEAEVLAEEPLVMVTAAGNRLSVLKELHKKRVGSFLGYNQNSRTYQLVERAFTQHGVSLQTTFYSTSPEIMLQLVLAGRGTAVLPYLLIKNDLAAGRLATIKLGKQGTIDRRIMSLRRSGRSIPSSAQGLLHQTQADLRVLREEARFVSYTY